MNVHFDASESYLHHILLSRGAGAICPSLEWAPTAVAGASSEPLSTAPRPDHRPMMIHPAAAPPPFHPILVVMMIHPILIITCHHMLG